MANILVLAPIHRNRRLPLRGDMEGVNLDLTPTDNKFKAHFYTEDAKSYTLTSAHKFFINGQVANSITMGGRPDLSIEMFFDPIRVTWVVTDHNLNMPTSSGSGTAIDTVSQATINAIINRLIPPGGAAGQLLGKDSNTNYAMTWIAPPAAGTGGTGGTSTPPAYMTGGTLLQYWGKTGNSDGQVGWLTLPSAGSGVPGGGTGIGSTEEVLLTQNAQGEITPDKLLGNRFRVMLTMPLVVKNPVGYGLGEDISIAMRHGPNGPYDITWEGSYAFKDRQPPTPPKQAGALWELYARLTGDIDASNKGGWMARITPEGAVVGYGVPAFIARNITTGVEYYVLRSPTVLAAMTEMNGGETLKILRNGLGIEAYGAIDGSNGAGNFLITGALPNGSRAELRTGVGVRSAFDRGVLAFAGSGNVTVQDLIISGAREQSGFSHVANGIHCLGSGNVTLKNVRVHDNEGGIMSTNSDYTGVLVLEDCELDNNGYGDLGYTHNIYTGRHPQAVILRRTTSKNCAHGHNLKHRDGVVTLQQVLAERCFEGRELNLPNGTNLLAENCIFHKYTGAFTGQLIGIGEEGIELSRTHGYIFRNCRFQSDYGVAGQDATFVINFDHVPMTFIDCEFVGDYVKSVQESFGMGPGMVTVNGIRYWPDSPPVFQFTGGPLGPILPVGYQTTAVTPVAG